MPVTQGYYSLIQYCPDAGRDERMNVGVLLCCPDLNYLDAYMLSGDDYDRVIAAFPCSKCGREEVEGYAWNIRAAFMAQPMLSRERIEHFIQTRFNLMIMTPLRSVAIREDAKLHHLKLFADLVDVQAVMDGPNGSVNR